MRQREAVRHRKTGLGFPDPDGQRVGEVTISMDQPILDNEGVQWVLQIGQVSRRTPKEMG